MAAVIAFLLFLFNFASDIKKAVMDPALWTSVREWTNKAFTVPSSPHSYSVSSLLFVSHTNSSGPLTPKPRAALKHPSYVRGVIYHLTVSDANDSSPALNEAKWADEGWQGVMRR